MKCDICKSRVALFDAKTTFGSWANLCEICYARYGIPTKAPAPTELEKAVHILYGWDEVETAPEDEVEEDLDAIECEYCNYYCDKCTGGRI